MTNESVQIKSGNAEDHTEAGSLIYESSHELFDFMFGDRSTAQRVIGTLYKKTIGHFSYQFSTLLFLNGKVVGLELGYNKEELENQELRGNLALFFTSPLSNWWRLIRTIGPVLDDYIQKPGCDTYYINNIAISSDYRGKGLGEQLLLDTIDRAQRQGYDAVELDVTAVNVGAIGFYKKHGFVEMFRSGTEALHTKFALPPLIRMRRSFRPVEELIQVSEITGNVNPLIVNDVTGLNPVEVAAVFAPGSVEQLQRVVSSTDGPLSIGGGRFSMGGQIATHDSLHIDMRGLNRILRIDPEARVICVEGGTRWREIQAVVDQYNLSIKIMQTYANFTVGGSISVNCHGRYVGLGPLILSINSVDVMFHDGEIVTAGPTQNEDIFYGVVGGYGAFGIIVSAELALTTNTRVNQVRKRIGIEDYLTYFRDKVRENDKAVFHNADLYPPHYRIASAVTWFETDQHVSTKTRLKPRRRLYIFEKYFMWAITETTFGKWRREYLLDPIYYARSRVHWRNYEAGYDVNELEPLLKDRNTYVLQEYFVPVDQLFDFVAKIREILNRHAVNVVNISIRHAFADPGSYLAWAREEIFAFVLYYKQSTRTDTRHHVAVWTRELIDAVIELGGCYYLPYQPYGTKTQFHQAYPNAQKLFMAKRRYDPNYRFRNALWEKYYCHSDQRVIEPPNPETLFHSIYSNDTWRDNFYRFLQNIYRIYPEDRFHALIIEACCSRESDAEVYAFIQRQLSRIKPFLSELTLAVPSLVKQKREIAGQVSLILDPDKNIDGYLEIGSTGRYVKRLSKALRISGSIFLTNDVAPNNSPAEIMERGQLSQIGTFFPMKYYSPIPSELIADNSVDLVTCFIGLHHCPPENLSAYILSIHRILRDGGTFLLRDHDAADDMMIKFVSLVHTVFNLGLNVQWSENENELRHFAGVDHWVRCLEDNGFADQGHRILQANDPTDNTLMAFTKLKKQTRRLS